MKRIHTLAVAVASVVFFSNQAFAQNIAVNTSGAAASSTNMLEVTQSSTAAYMVALYAIHNGANAATDTGYAFKAIKTGATGNNVAAYFSATGGANNYALIIPRNRGYVGIGTVTPKRVMHIENGDARILTYDTDNTISWTRPAWEFGSFGATFQILSTHDYTTASALNRFTITQDGLVGIGTASPGALLHINPTYTISTDTKSLQSGLTYAGAGTMANWYGHYIAAPTITGGGAITTKYAMVTEAAAGNVGIGTTAPVGALHVSSSLFNIMDRTLTSGNPAHLLLRSCNGPLTAPTTVLSGNGLGMISFGGYDGAAWSLATVPAAVFGSATENWSATAHGTSLSLATTPNTTTTLQTRMYVDQNGNVGVGNIAPNVKLDVTGAINAAGNINSVWGDYTHYVQYPNAYTATPSYNMGYSVVTGTRRLFIDNKDGDGSAVDPNGGITFRTGGTPSDRMHISYSGNVGIGTTSPGSTLHLQGTNTLDAPKGDIVMARYWASSADARASSIFHYYNSTSGSDNLAFGVAGDGGTNGQPNALAQVKMLIQANGNVGIGTTTPSEIFHIRKDQNGKTRFKLQNYTNGNTSATVEFVAQRSNTGTTEVISMGIGDAAYNNTTYPVDFRGAYIYSDCSQGITLRADGGPIRFVTVNAAVPTENMSIKAGGTVCIPGDLYVGGTIHWGAWTTPGTCPSDIRYKKDITRLNSSLCNVLKLEGVNYFWKTKEFPDKHFTDDKQIGFIAQEIEKIYPELVVTDKDGFKSVDYSRLTPVLVEAMKEQQSIIEDQKKVNEEQAGDIKELREEIKKIKLLLGEEASKGKK